MGKRLFPVPPLAAALALIVAGVPTALAQDAAAQDTPVEATPAPIPIPQGVRQAPIGHRQPRPGELPRDVRRDERAGPTAAERAFDKKLENSICQKC
jgi:hypothetical protein